MRCTVTCYGLWIWSGSRQVPRSAAAALVQRFWYIHAEANTLALFPLAGHMVVYSSTSELQLEIISRRFVALCQRRRCWKVWGDNMGVSGRGVKHKRNMKGSCSSSAGGQPSPRTPEEISQNVALSAKTSEQKIPVISLASSTVPKLSRKPRQVGAVQCNARLLCSAAFNSWVVCRHWATCPTVLGICPPRRSVRCLWWFWRRGRLSVLIN